MKHLVLALGLSLAMTPFAVAPALAQKGGGHIVQRAQPGAECARGDRSCAKARKDAEAAKAAKAQNRAGPQFGASPAAPGPGQGAMGAGSGAPPKAPPSAFNTQMKPLGGPGYTPGALGR
jgi:hypothetical protein